MGFVIRRDSNKATLCTTYIILAEALAFDVNFYKQNLHLFITCQNYHFGKYVGWSCLLLAKISLKFCKYVRLTVCVFVCLSVRMDLVDTIQVAPFHQSSPNLTQIWTLGPDRSLLFF